MIDTGQITSSFELEEKANHRKRINADAKIQEIEKEIRKCRNSIDDCTTDEELEAIHKRIDGLKLKLIRRRKELSIINPF